MEKIDFVITWVDGNDKAWQKEKNKYLPSKTNDDRKARYRDWDTLKYWFRGVEKFAPWVNKIYFITYGHVPKWLDLSNEKLVVIKHEDYMPKEYLPTFNSIPIELNLHRIKSLSQNFVYFNDDVFIIKETKAKDFFKNDLPCDDAVMITTPAQFTYGFGNTLLNNMVIINKHFNIRNVLKKNPLKWFNFKYGKMLFRSIFLSTWNHFPCILNSHLSVSYKKDSFKEVWNLEPDLLDQCSKQKFRDNYNTINHYLIENYQKVTGMFYPRSIKFGAVYKAGEDDNAIIKAIRKQTFKCICINDNEEMDDIEAVKKSINDAFESILPEKSSFEI